MVTFLYDSWGYEVLFWNGAIFCILAGIICLFFTEQLDKERLDKKGLLVWGKKEC